VDNFLNSELCPRFKDEIDSAHSQNLLFPNATHLVMKNQVPSQTVFIEKKGIFEIDFVSKPPPLFPLFQAIDQQRELLTELACYYPALELSSHAIKGIS
jgi:hypothetical protein